MIVVLKFRKNCDEKIKKKIINLLNELKIKHTENIQQADLAIIIGGDGTFLFWQSQISCPILGIKDRGVGHYMKASQNDFLKKIKTVLKGKEGKDYYIYKLLRITATLNKKILPPALNEYLVSSGLTREMFNCQLKIRGDESLERNSGIIVYTPTGSSAFAKSAGAEELKWDDKRMGIVALAPYSGRLKKGEILLSKGGFYIKCLNKKGEICIDGQKKYTYKIKYNDRIFIQKSNNYAKVIGFSPNFYS